MSINSPVTTTTNPSMYAHDLFNRQTLRPFSTGALDDDGTFTFKFNEDGADVMNGVYIGYVTGSTDVYVEFTVSGGDTITILRDVGSDFVANGTTTDAKIQIDADSNGLTIVNRIDAGIAGLELVKIL